MNLEQAERIRCGCFASGNETVIINQYTVFGDFLVQGALPELEFWTFYGKKIPTEAYVCKEGVIHIKFKKGYSMDITINKCVRLMNPTMTVIVVLNPVGQCSSLAHPISCVVQSPEKTGVVIQNHGVENSRHSSSITKHSLLFSHSNSKLVHCLDQRCLSSTFSPFWDVSPQLDFNAFLYKSQIGSYNIDKAREIIDPKNVKCWMDENRDQHYELELLGMHITQLNSGGVRAVFGENKKYEVQNSLPADSVKLASPTIRLTVNSTGKRKKRQNNDNNTSNDNNNNNNNNESCSSYQSQGPHFYLRQGKKKIYLGPETVTFYNGPKSAEVNKLGSLNPS